jgi:hypothetical protein
MFYVEDFNKIQEEFDKLFAFETEAEKIEADGLRQPSSA